MESKSTINQRIKEVYEVNEIKSRRAFARACGISPSTFESVLGGTDPGYQFLSKLLESNPRISAEWLMRGEGSMMRCTEQQGQDEHTDLGATVAEIIRQNAELIRLLTRDQQNV